TAGGPHRGKTGSGPCCRPRAAGAAASAMPAPRPWTARSEMDPLVQGSRAAGIGCELVDELRHARGAPRALEPRPDVAERLPPPVAADGRPRGDELDEPVRKHDQQRRRMLEAVTQFLEQPGLVEVDAHPAAVLDRLFA